MAHARNYSLYTDSPAPLHSTNVADNVYFQRMLFAYCGQKVTWVQFSWFGKYYCGNCDCLVLSFFRKYCHLIEPYFWLLDESTRRRRETSEHVWTKRWKRNYLTVNFESSSLFVLIQLGHELNLDRTTWQKERMSMNVVELNYWATHRPTMKTGKQRTKWNENSNKLKRRL